jgi:lysophospholipase L1-like esterase
LKSSLSGNGKPEVIGAARSVGLAVVLAIVVLALVELAFQVRAQQRTGESVFTLMLGRTTYVRHPQLDVRILRPSSVIKGSKQTIESNRYGLRGDDFEPTPSAGEQRISLLGASTIMGAYAPTNQQTSSAALERLLNSAADRGRIRVVNAGLGGTTIQGQTQILAGVLPTLGVEQVIWYPGSNDIGCSAPAAGKTSRAIRLPWPPLPKWTLTSDIVVKNTAFLRRSNAAASQSLRPNFDQAAVKAEIERGVRSARQAGLSIVLVTSATSFRSDMPDPMITTRAASALFFRPCYSGPELARAIDSLNAALREVAREQDVPLIDAAQLLPADLSLFGDASHFSVAGEEAFAAVVAQELNRQQLLPRARLP